MLWLKIKTSIDQVIYYNLLVWVYIAIYIVQTVYVKFFLIE